MKRLSMIEPPQRLISLPRIGTLRRIDAMKGYLSSESTLSPPLREFTEIDYKKTKLIFELFSCVLYRKL